MGSITVVVADDNDAIRHTLTALLHSDPRFEVVGHAATGEALLEVVTTTRPHVALLDVRMPGGGPEAARALTGAHSVVVIGVSSETSTHIVVDMVRAGVRGYLVKDRVGSSLPDLVARCAAGEVVLATPTGAEALRQLIGPPRR